MSLIRTIGYQGTSFGAVLDALTFAGVRLLVDVRAVAASRRPGFSKRQLAAGLAEAGIGYVHLRPLGTPAEGRAAARSGRHDEMRRIFLAHLATPPAEAALAELKGLIRSGPPLCLLCFERDHRHCHRSLIAERLTAETGVGVQHLGDGEPASPAPSLI